MSGTAIVLKDAFVAIGPADDATAPTNISCQVTDVTIDLNADVLETTAICETSKTKIIGLKDSTFSLTANQDFTDNGLDEVLWGFYSNSTLLSIHVRPRSAAVGAANPAYTANVYISNYRPFDGGGVGQTMTTPIELASNGDVVRATA